MFRCIGCHNTYKNAEKCLYCNNNVFLRLSPPPLRKTEEYDTLDNTELSVEDNEIVDTNDYSIGEWGYWGL